VAKAITRGANKYFARKAPPGTWLAETRAEHVASAGENIGSVAQKYNVTETDLRARNALHAENLVAGQVIKIPVG
jgi:LysM repeat protein